MKGCVAGLLVLLGLLGCQRAAPKEQDGAPLSSFTHYTERTELFVEFAPLCAGQESPFAVHLTRLADFKPVAAGAVTVTLRDEAQGSEERFTSGAPQPAGIFRPLVRPTRAGPRRLVITLAAADLAATHDLGVVPVYASASAARAAAGPEGAGGKPIPFLKEQQWQTDFAVVAVGEQALRPSLALAGVLRGRSAGEARVIAPAAGRWVLSGAALAHVGQRVAQDQVLAQLAPRVGGVDRAALDLELSRARLLVEHSGRERQRLEGLLREEAVPETRVVAARHDEAAARATLLAAERRLGQYQGTQQASAAGASSRLQVRSPLAGTLVEIRFAPGSLVEEGSELFRVIDLSRLWLEVYVPAADLPRLPEATQLQGAWFTVEGRAQRFEARAPLSGPGLVEPRTHAASLLLDVDNPAGVLLPGLFAQVRLITGAAQRALAVPVGAVLEEDGQAVAYVQVSGESFERRPLRLGLRDGDFIAVREGLAVGERVVTQGAYQVRLAAASGAIPAHGHVH